MEHIEDDIPSTSETLSIPVTIDVPVAATAVGEADATLDGLTDSTSAVNTAEYDAPQPAATTSADLLSIPATTEPETPIASTAPTTAEQTAATSTIATPNSDSNCANKPEEEPSTTKPASSLDGIPTAHDGKASTAALVSFGLGFGLLLFICLSET